MSSEVELFIKALAATGKILFSNVKYYCISTDTEELTINNIIILLIRPKVSILKVWEYCFFFLNLNINHKIYAKRERFPLVDDY